MKIDKTSCWAILGIPANTDRKAVRSAYALALKRLDLTTQANEFAALRAAYDQALEQIASGTVPLESAPPPDTGAASVSATDTAPADVPLVRMGTINVDDFDAPAEIFTRDSGLSEGDVRDEPSSTDPQPDAVSTIEVAADPDQTDSADDASGVEMADDLVATRDRSAPLRARDLRLRPAQQSAPTEAELAQLAAHQRVNAFFQLCDSFGVPRTAILQQALRDFLHDDALDSLLARESFVKELANQAFVERLYTPTLIPALSAELGWELDTQAMPATIGSAQMAFQRWQRQRDSQRLQMNYSAAECEALDDARVEWRVRAARHIAAVAAVDVGKLAAMTDEVLNRSMPAWSASEQEKHIGRLRQLIVDDVAEIGHYDLYCAVADVLRRDRMSPQEFERNHYYVAQQLLEDGRVTRAIRQAEQQANPRWEQLSRSVREGYAAWEQKRFLAFLRFFLGTTFGVMRYESGVIGKLGYLRRNRDRWDESFEPACRNWLRGIWMCMFATMCMGAVFLATMVVSIYIAFEMR